MNSKNNPSTSSIYNAEHGCNYKSDISTEGDRINRRRFLRRSGAAGAVAAVLGLGVGRSAYGSGSSGTGSGGEYPLTIKYCVWTPLSEFPISVTGTGPNPQAAVLAALQSFRAALESPDNDPKPLLDISPIPNPQITTQYFECTPTLDEITVTWDPEPPEDAPEIPATSPVLQSDGSYLHTISGYIYYTVGGYMTITCVYSNTD